MPRKPSLLLAGCTAALVFSGCATSGGGVVAPPPEAAPQLRMALASDPGNADLSWRLASALRSGGRATEASEVVDEALSETPDHAPSLHLQGVLLEESGDLAGAVGIYERFMALDEAESLRDEVRKRLTWLRRQLVEVGVQDALASEAALSDADPTPGTLAIFPFVYRGADPTQSSLGRALTHMLATDMAATGRLTVLERLQVQLLADEISLTDRDRVDPATAVRGGRMLQAQHLVQGQVGGDTQRLSLAAAVLETAAGGADPTPVEVEEALERFFEAEGQLALGLFDAIGIELTAAEREQVGRRRTESLQSLIAFGLGLEAQDAGQYSAAREAYEQAVDLDPGFQDAIDALQEARDLEEAEEDDLDEFAALGGELLRPSPWELWLDRRGTYMPIEEIIPDVGGRDPFEEVGGGEPISPQRGTVIIFIPRPGGGS
ncbi:MAG: tetratricopeptide repeat protein [Gemmatimonadetes bacterium]|nr:tetratricopeptide repeat protein [Gemmatimonadota bacterium]